jgi:hypothetical protein
MIRIYHPGWKNSREIMKFWGHIPDKYRPEVRGKRPTEVGI